jgi:hypothetical protein
MDMILNGDYDDIGAEKLRGLMKILPEQDEVILGKNLKGTHEII